MENSNNNKPAVNGLKPNLPKRLFWDWRFDKIDWVRLYVSVIDRVIERGNKDEWNEMIRFYGEDRVINALKKEIKYLPDYIIPDVCSYFDLKQEELACFARKQLRRGHWI
jgi:hypothetical protein